MTGTTSDFIAVSFDKAGAHAFYDVDGVTLERRDLTGEQGLKLLVVLESVGCMFYLEAQTDSTADLLAMDLPVERMRVQHIAQALLRPVEVQAS
jgi:hypothetical protein